MTQILVPPHGKSSLRDEGMLFVRTEGILQTMIKAPLLVAGLIVVAIAMPLQTSFSSTRSLDLVIYQDGSTHVSLQYDVDPLESNFEIKLFGTTIDNFVAVGEDGFLLSGDLMGDSATIETFGSESISVDYDTHDLVSKSGRIWTFEIDSSSDYTLLMPRNSVVVGMSNIPDSMEIINEQSKLMLPSGPTQIDYVFGTSMPPVQPTAPESGFDSTIVIIGAAIVAAVAGVTLIRRNQKISQKTVTAEKHIKPTDETQNEKLLDAQTIFEARPDLREDDKEIIKFIHENGGQALESELRKKFLQPRTTMWRAVKRLERHGIIEIEKKDLQNLVKLRKKLEEEE